MPSFRVYYYVNHIERHARYEAKDAEAAKALFPGWRARLAGTHHRLTTASGKLLAGTNPASRKWRLKPQQALPFEKG